MATVIIAAVVAGVAGGAGTAAAATPAPRVTQVSPAAGAAGAVVTISGTNLTGATAVTFGPGNDATTFSVTNATTVTATAPAGSGTVDVQVTTPSGTSQVQTLDWFTYSASLTLNPTEVTVPADGSIEGAISATLTNSGSPASGITVSATESTPSMSSQSLTGCTTGSNGSCLIDTETDTTVESGTVTVTASGFATGVATVVYSAPGTAPTGLTMALANGDGSSAALSGADTFSDGNHYFADETSGLPGQYENTASQAVVSATIVNGSTPLTTGTEPYALNWSLHNTGTNTLYIDAIANTSEMPYTNVICTLATQTDPNTSLSCTPSSYDLDYNPHFSNPANPGAIGLGVTNNTMTAQTGGVRTVAAGATITFTTYMVGQANDAMVVLDSPSPTSATISAQLAQDQAFATVEKSGATIGSTVSSNLKWLAPAGGSSSSGTVLASDLADDTTTGSTHNWVVLNATGAPTLVRFGQSGGQTYTDNGTTVSEAAFENDVATASSGTLAETNYGISSQMNAFTTVPSVTGVSPSSGSTGGGTSVVITGTNFTGATTVKFGSIGAASFTVNSPTQITATAPAKAAGTVDVTATAPPGTSAVNAPADQFTFIAPAIPSVTGISPTFGSTAGGTAVTITGTNLTGATGVSFGTTAAAYIVNNPTEITATTPAEAGGNVDVTVTTSWGTSATSGADVFTYVQPPSGPTQTGAATSGYDLVGADGGVFVFPQGQAGGYYGSLPGLGVRVDDIAGMVPSPDERGYFLVGADGGVFAFGDAPYLGSLPGLGVSVHDIKGIVPTRDDRGYFLVGADGGVFAFGDAPFLGSLPSEGVHLSDVVGIAPTPSDQGYWVVSASGSVFPFGDAAALGGLAASSSPVAGITATPDGGGYWIVTQHGGVFTFGDAGAYGSLPGIGVAPTRPVIGLVPTADDRGYWLIGSDGGIFTFGDAPFVGSLPGLGLRVTDIVGAVPTKV